MLQTTEPEQLSRRGHPTTWRACDIRPSPPAWRWPWCAWRARSSCSSCGWRSATSPSWSSGGIGLVIPAFSIWALWQFSRVHLLGRCRSRQLADLPRGSERRRRNQGDVAVRPSRRHLRHPESVAANPAQELLRYSRSADRGWCDRRYDLAGQSAAIALPSGNVLRGIQGEARPLRRSSSSRSTAPAFARSSRPSWLHGCARPSTPEIRSPTHAAATSRRVSQLSTGSGRARVHSAARRLGSHSSGWASLQIIVTACGRDVETRALCDEPLPEPGVIRAAGRPRIGSRVSRRVVTRDQRRAR